MNTPDTERHELGIEHSTGANSTHLLKDTPDTEWEKTVDSWRMFSDSDLIHYDYYTVKTIKDFIRTLLTSRDTYWKERLEEIMKLDIGDCSPTRTALQTLLDNLK